jgi:hypothetical protein
MFNDFLKFFSDKHNLNYEDVFADCKAYLDDKDQRQKVFMSVEGDYKTFLDKNEDELEKMYAKDHPFQTSVRGLKFRGAFPTEEEAETRANTLREKDPDFSIFVGEVGVWMPFDPDAYKTGKVEFMEEELNQLVHNKMDNERLAKEQFDERIKETKRKAIEENQKIAEKTGNRLTQRINEKGELEGIEHFIDNLGVERELNTAERDLKDTWSAEPTNAAAINKELFDDSDVVLDKNTDHGASRLKSGPFASSSASASASSSASASASSSASASASS